MQTQSELLGCSHIKVHKLVESLLGSTSTNPWKMSAGMAHMAEAKLCNGHPIEDGTTINIFKFLHLTAHLRWNMFDIEVLPKGIGGQHFPQFDAAAHDVMNGRQDQKLLGFAVRETWE